MIKTITKCEQNEISFLTNDDINENENENDDDNIVDCNIDNIVDFLTSQI